MNPLIKGAVFSLLPVSELRGGIPIAVYGGANIIIAYFVCVFFNLMVAPAVFFFLEKIHCKMISLKWYNLLSRKFIERTRKKVHKKIEKYGYFGLFLFTMIPLPITGAYTATIGAWFFGMKKIKSIIAISLGIIVAGIIISATTTIGYLFI